jgi:hypothetical protein
MRYLLDTFFFGYLPLKWRRLLRIISVLYFLVLLLIVLEMYSASSVREYLISLLISSFWIIPSIILVSWALKPFVTKDQ